MTLSQRKTASADKKSSENRYILKLSLRLMLVAWCVRPRAAALKFFQPNATVKGPSTA